MLHTVKKIYMYCLILSAAVSNGSAENSAYQNNYASMTNETDNLVLQKKKAIYISASKIYRNLMEKERTKLQKLCRIMAAETNPEIAQKYKPILERTYNGRNVCSNPYLITKDSKSLPMGLAIPYVRAFNTRSIMLIISSTGQYPNLG